SALSGSKTHFHAYSKSSAVTGSPFDQFASSRILNVYVNPSSETSMLSAIASSGSPSKLIRVNPSNTWSSTALDVVSDDVPGCNEGGSDLMLRFNSCSSANASSPDALFSLSLFPVLPSALLFPPHAARKIVKANAIVRSKDHFLQFII